MFLWGTIRLRYTYSTIRVKKFVLEDTNFHRERGSIRLSSSKISLTSVPESRPEIKTRPPSQRKHTKQNKTKERMRKGSRPPLGERTRLLSTAKGREKGRGKRGPHYRHHYK